jgi:hypothetical protein
MGEHQWRGYVLRKFSEVLIVPGRRNTVEYSGITVRAIPANSKSIPVGGRHAKLGMQALINQ